MNTTEDEKSENLSRISNHSKPLHISCTSKVKRFRPLSQGPCTLQFEPMRFSEFEKELEEAEKEPLQLDQQKDIVDKENVPLALNLQEIIKTNTKTVIENNILEIPDSNALNVSKDKLNIGVNWTNTPAKSGQRTYNNFLTPVNSYITPKFKYNSTLSKVQEECRPKIQYSMSVRSILKTPVSSNNIRQTPTLRTNYASQNNHNKNVNGDKVQYCMPIDRQLIEQYRTLTVKNITYVVWNELGRGGSSVVYHCYNHETKTERAIKRVNLDMDGAIIDSYINEVKMLHKLQHCDRIIKMYEYEILEEEKVLFIVLEKGSLDLSKILKGLSCDSNHLPTYMLIYYWMEMLYAVKQIHQNGIIHSDLKPANFLNVAGGLRLIDFGIASCLQNDMTSIIRNVTIGSFNYISPEALTNNTTDSTGPNYKISYKSDVWSLGCILYQFVYRKTPFQHIAHTHAKLSAILDPQQEIQYPEADWVPLYIINTIKDCLQFDVKSRPSIDDLLKQYENIYY